MSRAAVRREMHVTLSLDDDERFVVVDMGFRRSAVSALIDQINVEFPYQESHFGAVTMHGRILKKDGKPSLNRAKVQRKWLDADVPDSVRWELLAVAKGANGPISLAVPGRPRVRTTKADQ